MMAAGIHRHRHGWPSTRARVLSRGARNRKTTSAVVAMLMLLGACLNARGETPESLDLAQRPIFLRADIAPNILLTVDDSTSMRASDVPVDSRITEFACGDPRLSAALFNALAFNPDVNYPPPRIDLQRRVAPANFNAAIFDPATVVDLARNFVPSQGASGATYGDCSGRLPNGTTGRLKPEPAYYTRYKGAGDISQWSSFDKIAIAPEQRQNFANWFQFYRTRQLVIRNALKEAVGGLRADSARVAWGALNTSLSATSNTVSSIGWINTIASLDDARFAQLRDWIDTLPTSGDTPLRPAFVRARDFFARTGAMSPLQSRPGVVGEELACRRNYHVVFTDGGDSTGSNALPGASWMPNNPNGTVLNLPSPDPELPDAPTLGLYDPAASYARLYADPPLLTSGPRRFTLTDIAFAAWAEDLREDLRNLVPPRIVDNATSPTEPAWNARNDPSTWQNIVTFGIGVGVTPSLPVTPGTIENLRTGTAGFFANNLIDDFWHATLVSRGAMFLANDLPSMGTALTSILGTITQGVGGSGGLSLQSGTVSDGALAYVGGYISGAWSGTLRAQTLDAQAQRREVLWDAGCILTGGYCAATGKTLPAVDAEAQFARRMVLTVAGPALPPKVTVTRFRWQDLSPEHQTLLMRDTPPTMDPEAIGRARAEWIAGSRVNESANAAIPLRPRSSLLGDIINSRPVMVGRPLAGYPDKGWPVGSPEDAQPYSAFAIAHRDRARRVYVGANDGMLHAFRDDGTEQYAYVPNGVYPRLAELTWPDYTHRAYVDATPISRDVMIDGRWASVIVGTLGAGGTGMYMLDVTDADGISDTVTWDITGDDSRPDLGHIMGGVVIARLADGHWWAITGNGYNSASGRAALILMRLDGQDYRVLLTGAVADPLPGRHRANGLGPATLSDFNSDLIGEFAYAGDLYGNLWKFDLTDSNPARWHVYQTADLPLLAAAATPYRPITAQPRVARARDGMPVIIVGTGKELELDDKAASANRDQVIYGVFDDGARDSTRLDDLVEQTATPSHTGSFDTREISEHPVAYPGSRGWYLRLPDDGEHVTLGATLRSSTALVATTVPAADDPCLAAATGWLMALDVRTGRVPLAEDALGVGMPAPYFDVTRDGRLDASDLGARGVGGIAIGGQIIDVATSVDVFGNDVNVISTTNRGGISIGGAGFGPRRLSWRDITAWR